MQAKFLQSMHSLRKRRGTCLLVALNSVKKSRRFFLQELTIKREVKDYKKHVMDYLLNIYVLGLLNEFNPGVFSYDNRASVKS